MPFVQITWLPKACRNAAVRKEVADAVMKVRAICDGSWPHALMSLKFVRESDIAHPFILFVSFDIYIGHDIGQGCWY